MLQLLLTFLIVAGLIRFGDWILSNLDGALGAPASPADAEGGQ